MVFCRHRFCGAPNGTTVFCLTSPHLINWGRISNKVLKTKKHNPVAEGIFGEGGEIMKQRLRNILEYAILLSSVGLGLRLLAGAYSVLSGEVQSLYPEIVAADPSFIISAKMEMPLDILSGIFLIFWPFYHEWRRRK